MLLQTAVTQSQAMFTNDLAGYVKLFLAIVAGNAAVGSLAFYWLKHRSAEESTKVLEKLNGLGKRVEEVKQEAHLTSAWRADIQTQRARDDAKFTSLGERLAKQEAHMDELQREIHDHHREQRDLIHTSAEKQVAAVHRLELQITALREQSTLGESLEKVVRLFMERGKSS